VSDGLDACDWWADFEVTSADDSIIGQISDGVFVAGFEALNQRLRRIRPGTASPAAGRTPSCAASRHSDYGSLGRCSRAGKVLDRILPFGLRLAGCEHPLDSGTGTVALVFPGCDFGFEFGPLAAAASRHWLRRTPISTIFN
jgi:hypothetical protein